MANEFQDVKKFKVTLSANGVIIPTDQGSNLKLSAHVIAEVSFEGIQQGDDDFPTTFIVTHCDIADVNGQVWRISSVVDSEVLIRSIMDVSAMSPTVPWTHFGPDAQSNFITNAHLRDIKFSSDDRFVRQVIVDDKIVDAQFKYTFITFELFVIPDANPVGTYYFPKVYARFTDENSWMNVETYEPVPSLVFPLKLRYLMENKAVFIESDNRWEISDIPVPRMAKQIVETSAPQPTISVSPRSN